MHTMIPARRTVLSLMLLAPLGACGFHLRGSQGDFRLPFATLYLDVQRKSAIERELRSAVLGQDGITLTTEAKSAEATLRILSENEEKKILTLNAQGQVREYSLLYRLSFEVKDSDGKTLLEPTELALQTSMAFSESEVLAKETEERMIFTDLRNDAINQLMRRLTLLKPV